MDRLHPPAILGERNRLAEHRVTFRAAVSEGIRSTMADCMTRVWLNAGATVRDHVRWSGRRYTSGRDRRDKSVVALLPAFRAGPT